MVDLRDLHTNTRDGLHMASLAGAWTALVGGFGGLRDDEQLLSLNPHLPEGISRLTFGLRWRNFRLRAVVDHTEVTYLLRDGPDGELTIRHAGDDLTLSTREPTTVAIKACPPLLPEPPQPPGREPQWRGRRLSAHPD